MKRGTNINGYLVLQDFTTAGGGLSKWTFADKGGKTFFLKEFLRPTWPSEGSPGSALIKEKKKEECEAFETHHKELMKAINSVTAPGGNLISTLDFFRWGPKYYKVTDKVDVTTLKPAQIASLPLNQRLLIMVTVAHSLRILHKVGIVHNDLKLDNVLIKRTRLGSYTSKLIDFDSSYFSGNPPANAEEVIGDLVFYSPELARYIQEVEGIQAGHLTTQSDIFALGLLYSLYLTGKLPDFDRNLYRYACIAVNSGLQLEIQDSELIPESVRTLINRMLLFNPAERPGIEQVFESLKGEIKAPDESAVAAAEEKSAESPPVNPLQQLLKNRLEHRKEESDESNPRLKGSLLNKK